MKKYNKENYIEITPKDIIELARSAYAKMNTLISEGNKVEIDSNGIINNCTVGSIKVLNHKGRFVITIDGINIEGIAREIPQLRRYHISEINEIGQNMFDTMYGHCHFVDSERTRDDILEKLNSLNNYLNQ